MSPFFAYHVDTAIIIYKTDIHLMASFSRTTWVVGWILTSLFSTNKAISEKKGQGWRVILTQ